NVTDICISDGSTNSNCPLLRDLTSLFTSGLGNVFAPGESRTRFFDQAEDHGITNRVTVLGFENIANSAVSAFATATSQVVEARIMCTKEVSTNGIVFSSSVTNVDDGVAHTVFFRVIVSNISDPGVVLTNVMVSES